MRQFSGVITILACNFTNGARTNKIVAPGVMDAHTPVAVMFLAADIQIIYILYNIFTLLRRTRPLSWFRVIIVLHRRK